MPLVNKERVEKNTGRAVASNNIKSHASDPFFVKKAAEAKKTISRTGLPRLNEKK